MRTDRAKYILTPRGKREELYDMTADPKERRNLAASPAQTEIAKELGRQLGMWARVRPRAPSDENSDQQTVEEIRSLGYVE